MVRQDFAELLSDPSDVGRVSLQANGNKSPYNGAWTNGLDMITNANASRLPVWSGNGEDERKPRRKRSDNRVHFGEVEITTFRKPPIIRVPNARRATTSELRISSPVVQRRPSKPLFERKSRARAYQDSLKHVIQEGFVFRKGAHVSYNCVYSYVLDFAPGDLKRAISPKDVVEAVAHAYPKVMTRAIERQFCIFINMAMIEHDNGTCEVLHVTKRELSPLLNHSDGSRHPKSPKRRAESRQTKGYQTSPSDYRHEDTTPPLQSPLYQSEVVGTTKKRKSKRFRGFKSHHSERSHIASAGGISPRGGCPSVSPEGGSECGSYEASMRRAEFRLMSLFQGTVSDDESEYASSNLTGRKNGICYSSADEARLPYETHQAGHASWASNSEESLRSSTTGTLSTLTSLEDLETGSDQGDNTIGVEWNEVSIELSTDQFQLRSPMVGEVGDAFSVCDQPNRYYFSAFLLQPDYRGHSKMEISEGRNRRIKNFLEVPRRSSDETRRRYSFENHPFNQRRQRMTSYRRHSSESSHGELQQKRLSIELPSRCSSESMLIGGEQMPFQSNNIPSRDEFGVLTNQTVSVLCRPGNRYRSFSGCGIPIMPNSSLAQRVSMALRCDQKRVQLERDSQLRHGKSGVDAIRMAVVKSFTSEIGNKITLTEVRYHLAKIVDCSVHQLPDDDILLKCFFEVFDSFGFEVLTDKLTCLRTVYILHIKHRRQLLAGQGKQRSLPETESQLMQEQQKCRITGLFSPVIYDCQSGECDLRRRSKTSSVESVLIAT